MAEEHEVEIEMYVKLQSKYWNAHVARNLAVLDVVRRTPFISYEQRNPRAR